MKYVLRQELKGVNYRNDFDDLPTVQQNINILIENGWASFPLQLGSSQIIALVSENGSLATVSVE